MDNGDAEIWNESGRGGFLLEAKRADRPIKNWPLLTPVTSPGKPLAHSHTCYYRLYRPEAGETKQERKCQEKMYAWAFSLYCTSAEWNWGRVCTHFFTIACKCNSGSEKREEDLNRLYSWDLPFTHTRSVALQVLNLDWKTASRGSVLRFFCQCMLTVQWTCLSDLP